MGYRLAEDVTTCGLLEMTSKRQARVLRRASTRELREEIRRALAPDRHNGLDRDTKEWVRARHTVQREALLSRMRPFLQRYETQLLHDFAAGNEVDPAQIQPIVSEVRSEEDVRLFRYAALHWSVPVSGGFGRRTRFLVRDAQNTKLIGIFCLSDPVYNLTCRDERIGWPDAVKRERLYRVLDASVIGSLPPYSQLLGGKLVALCAISNETLDLIERKYHGKRTVIRKRVVDARPVLITTTSALGRSSIYNRLTLNTRHYYEAIGWTKGYGHFQLPEGLFDRLLELMDSAGMKKARTYAFGNGPNWKMRTLRVGLEFLGLDPALLRHGIAREVFIAPTASNWRSVLRAERSRPTWLDDDLVSLSKYFRERWAIPRASRMPEYRNFSVDALRLLRVPEQPGLRAAF